MTELSTEKIELSKFDDLKDKYDRIASQAPKLKNKISQRKNTIRELANNGKFEYASDYTSFVRGEISSIKNQKQFNRFLKMRSPDYGSSNNSLSDFFNALKNIEELPRKEQYDLSASILIQVQDLYKEFQSEFPDAQPTGVDTVFN